MRDVTIAQLSRSKALVEAAQSCVRWDKYQPFPVDLVPVEGPVRQNF